jgi:hypothetical protein
MFYRTEQKEYLMKQIQLASWDATKIGLLLSAGVAFLFLIVRPDSWSFTIFGVNAIIIVALFGIIGALAGRFLLRTQKGAWLGAGLTLILLFWWLYTIVSNAPLD